jgi:type IV pilus assembly protein PilC
MPTHELAAFTRQLQVLLQAGLPLLNGLALMLRSARSAPTRALLARLRQQIMAGRALHVALQLHPGIPRQYIRSVAAGEASGALPQVLERLTRQLESRAVLQRQLRSAFTYPAVVMAIALSVLGVMMVWVIPAFEAMFTSLGAPLPLATRWVLRLSHLGVQSWPWLVAGCIVLTLWGRHAWRRPSTRQRALAWLWHVPGWGDLHRLACQSRWTRTLATLVAAGLPLTDALSSLDGAAGHPRYDEANRQIRRALVAGRSLSEAMARHGPDRTGTRRLELFSGMMLQMTHIGEESGALETLLERAAEQLEREVAERVAALSRLVEPALMVVLGGLVGGLVMALYLPLFQLGQVL